MLILVLLLFLAGSDAVFGDDILEAGAEKAEINDIHVLLFILDGTPKDFLYGLIQDGTLPTLKRYFWNGGAHAKAAVTTFPSASAPAYQSFITGLFAGRSGIPYLQWYDRKAGKDVDYLGLDFARVNDDMRNFYDDDKKPITIMEMLKGLPTATVYSEISRGAAERHPPLPLAALSDVFITHRQENLDVRAFDIVKRLFMREKINIPRFTLVGLYSADVLQHKDGAASEDAKYALVQFDLFLKEFLDILASRRLSERTYIVVAADHGMHNITHHVDLAPFLTSLGFAVKSGNPRQKEADIFISERGVASAHLYLLGGLDAAYLVENLRNHEHLSLVVVKNGSDLVDVYSKECHGRIVKKKVSTKIFYGYTADGCDPLGYCSDGRLKDMCGGLFYNDREWLLKTWDMPYPDGVVQLGQIFDDGRAGDIFVVADDKGGFFRSKSATHGSLIKEDMHVPLLIRGPGILTGGFGPVRTVDLYPTMLLWFGLKGKDGRDGMPFEIASGD